MPGRPFSFRAYFSGAPRPRRTEPSCARLIPDPDAGTRINPRLSGIFSFIINNLM
jgi:hypothetical protein